MRAPSKQRPPDPRRKAWVDAFINCGHSIDNAAEYIKHSKPHYWTKNMRRDLRGVVQGWNEQGSVAHRRRAGRPRKIPLQLYDELASVAEKGYVVGYQQNWYGGVRQVLEHTRPPRQMEEDQGLAAHPAAGFEEAAPRPFRQAAAGGWQDTRPAGSAACEGGQAAEADEQA